MVLPVACAAGVAVFVAGCSSKKIRGKLRQEERHRKESKDGGLYRQSSFHTACSSDSTDAPSGGVLWQSLREEPSEVIDGGHAPTGKELACTSQLRERLMQGGALDFAERWLEDGELLRYLRARGLCLTEAEELLRQALLWRVDKVKRWSPGSTGSGSFGGEHSELLLASSRGGPSPPAWWRFLHAHVHIDIYGEDRFGIPITYSNVGDSDLEGCAREAGLDSLRRYLVYQNDFFLDRARNVSRSKSEESQRLMVLHGGIVIIDLGGLGWHHRRGVQILKDVTEVCKFLHPERQRRCFLVRAPRVFSMIWQLVTPMLDQRTREKMVIVSDGESLQPLEEEVGRRYLPESLGGHYNELPQRPKGRIPEGAFAAFSRRNAASF